jgi:uncharacterized delta-60 repeat protein
MHEQDRLQQMLILAPLESFDDVAAPILRRHRGPPIVELLERRLHCDATTIQHIVPPTPLIPPVPKELLTPPTTIQDISGGLDWITDMIVQPDGDILAGGYTYRNTSSDGSNGNYVFALLRYHPDGTLDQSFGSGGVVVTSGGSFGQAIAVLDSGKILLAGSANSGFAVAQYNFDGSLDGAFGKGGIASVRFGHGSEEANKLVVQSDGKIVLGGGLRNSGPDNHDDQDFALTRFNSDGSLDSAFGNGGLVVTRVASVATETRDTLTALTLQADGKIIAGGETWTLSSSGSGTSDFALVRYNPDGTLDTTFGLNGKVITSFLPAEADHFPYAEVRDIAVQSEGRIVVAGATDWGSLILARYTNDGALDETFGSDGIVAIAYTTPGSVCLEINDHNAITLAATSEMYSETNILSSYLGHFDADGAPLSAAAWTTRFDKAIIQGQAIALHPDGHLLIAGAAASSGSTISSFDTFLTKIEVWEEVDPTNPVPNPPPPQIAPPLPIDIRIEPPVWIVQPLPIESPPFVLQPIDGQPVVISLPVLTEEPVAFLSLIGTERSGVEDLVVQSESDAPAIPSRAFSVAVLVQAGKPLVAQPSPGIFSSLAVSTSDLDELDGKPADAVSALAQI